LILLAQAFVGSVAAANEQGGGHRRTTFKFNALRKISRFSDVAILQQALIKRAIKPQLRLSSVACSELFVSYRLATEGGIPSRPVLGGSLKSLAFMRECPKARSG
jgi:hypothetical protein